MLNVPLDTKYVISRMLFPGNLLPSTEKKVKNQEVLHSIVQVISFSLYLNFFAFL